MMARTTVGTDAASTSHRLTHQLASHHCVASDQASGVNGVPVPLLHSSRGREQPEGRRHEDRQDDGKGADDGRAEACRAHVGASIRVIDMRRLRVPRGASISNS